MDRNIFILGEINADLIITGEDVTPELNREKLVDRFDQVLGSSSAITASCLAGMGYNVFFVGVVGNDPFGHFCLDQLQKNGVDTSYVTIADHLQTGVTVSLSTKDDRALLTYMGAISELTEENIPDDIYSKADHIHFGSFYLQEKMKKSWKTIFAKAKKHSISTSFDTGWDPHNSWDREVISEVIQLADYFIPSEDEILNIFNINGLDQIIDQLPELSGKVVVKRGKNGSIMIEESKDILEAPALKVNPIDTTGAGDSFNAGLIAGHLQNLKGIELLEMANASGALATQRIGGASNVPSMTEVKEFMKKAKSEKDVAL
ncbi:carbohydrate kinase family protein [Lederbergia citri]|uniref:Carbohydrate kinase family protein n=1 Tax=Lederbergia citri TaxID=2833580 RepID=A0A942TIL1_9BACI|nr:carbohydrate kinase family protein [Lederbergia citri]MBS4197713.1 carbohydrate kinase family protein [Lederbergia citri]